jgi:hypothetical protein
MLTITALFAAELPSNADSDDRPTTPPEYIAVAASVEPTPGQRVAERQREIFIRDRFEEVFGVAAIDELTRAMGIDWDVLADIRIPFDNPTKRNVIRQLTRFMEVQTSTRKDDAFEALDTAILKFNREIKRTHRERLEEHTKRYFSLMFPESKISFEIKRGGDQLGSVVIITPTLGSAIKYYVKTHSAGLKSEQSSAAKQINPIELMVYKVLELLGIGCEVHFFGRDELNFYIATRDANECGGFTEYSKIKHSDKATKAPFWGILTDALNDDDQYNETHFDAVEAALARDELAQHFIHQMSFLDLLARLMLLTDLQTNGDNFGFVSHPASLPVLKVLDFRLCEVKSAERLRLTERSFGGFLDGNGLFRYASADVAVCYALRNRPVPLRVIEARSVFDRELQGWEQAIQEATVATHRALREEVNLEATELRRLLKDLEGYSDTLRGNFRLFETSLRQWRE